MVGRARRLVLLRAAAACCLCLLLTAAASSGAVSANDGPAQLASCTPHVHWLSHSVRPGEAVMVAGWCLGENSTVLLDGTQPLETVQGISGHSEVQAAAVMAVLPVGQQDSSRHTISVRRADGVTSNVISLDDVEVWWAQGDDGAYATAGGWVRVFGRSLLAPRPPPIEAPSEIREALSRLAGSWRHDAQIEQLRQLVAQHPEFLAQIIEPRTKLASETTLTLTPMNAAASVASITKVVAQPGLTAYSANFVLPVTLAPGEYKVSVDSGGVPFDLDFFERPAEGRTRVQSITVLPSEPEILHFEQVTGCGINLTYGANATGGVNSSATDAHPYFTQGSGTPIDCTASIKTAIARAWATAAATATPTVVRLSAGVYHVNGPIVVPDGVTLQGAGAALTALHFSSDNISTAPSALLRPESPSARWGVEDLTLYVLGFYHNVIHCPADVSRSGRFRMRHVTVRADAFHCMNGGSRNPPWRATGDGGPGLFGAVVRLGPLDATDCPNCTHDDVSTGPVNTPSYNVQVSDCDISGSWHLFIGQVEYGQFLRNRLWNGGMSFYLIPRQTILEGNDVTGSSVMAAGGGYNFAQHLFMGENRVRFVRGNDREVMTYDGSDAVYYGTPLTVNATHVVAPFCAGRADSRYEGNTMAGGQIMIVGGIAGVGQYRRVTEAGCNQTLGCKDTNDCWWKLDRPFAALDGVRPQNITIIVTSFTGRSIFHRNDFEDTGHFQFYHSGIHNIAAEMNFVRTEGAWSTGMVVNWQDDLNNTASGLAPNPCYFAEFLDNRVTTGHRAPHTQWVPSRDHFWNDPIEHGLYSMGISGQGQYFGKADLMQYPGGTNRFQVFRRNSITGLNGINVWGLDNSDTLVESNVFNSTNLSVGLDYFPGNNPAPVNSVIRNSKLV